MASRKAWSSFQEDESLGGQRGASPSPRTTSAVKKSNSSSESSHVKPAAQEAAIVGASSVAGKKVPQLTQPTRAPKGVAEKSTAEAAKRSARRSSQKEHPLEQPRPLE
jgi:hypothetical protein